MTLQSKPLYRAALTAILLTTLILAGHTTALRAQAPGAAKPTATIILPRTEAGAILPPSVFFRGQSAPTQARNSAGLRTPGGALVLMTLVDTSGYSSALQQTYQAYLITEVPLTFGSETLKPGAYGFGFIADNRLVVLDLGGNEILHGQTTRDDKLTRPTPLQILPDTAPNSFRLYLGRSYVPVSPASTLAAK
jgi:hypothetical protein